MSPSPSPPDLPAWVHRTFAAADDWFAAAPSPLNDRLERVRHRVARAQGGDSLRSALTSIAATPFLAWTEALRRDLDLPNDGAIDHVGQGTLALYFYLRVQDDMIDEPTSFDPSFAYVAELFAGRSAEAFARSGATPAFWAFRAKILTSLAAVSAWELDVYRSASSPEAPERAMERLGHKLSPIAIPLAACASIARKEALFDDLERASVSVGGALQIVNDLFNARDDHAAGRLTPSLAALYEGGRVKPGDPPHRVWATLASDPALDRMLTIARAMTASAIARLSSGATPALREAIRAHASLLDEVPSRLLSLTLGVRR